MIFFVFCIGYSAIALTNTVFPGIGREGLTLSLFCQLVAHFAGHAGCWVTTWCNYKFIITYALSSALAEAAVLDVLRGLLQASQERKQMVLAVGAEINHRRHGVGKIAAVLGKEGTRVVEFGDSSKKHDFPKHMWPELTVTRPEAQISAGDSDRWEELWRKKVVDPACDLARETMPDFSFSCQLGVTCMLSQMVIIILLFFCATLDQVGRAALRT